MTNAPDVVAFGRAKSEKPANKTVSQNNSTGKEVRWDRAAQMRKQEKPRLRGIRGDLKQSPLDVALGIIAWLESLDLAIECLALRCHLERG